MRKFIHIVFLLLLITVCSESVFIWQQFKFTLKKEIIRETPIQAYSFKNLQKTKFPSNPIKIGSIVRKNSDSISQQFYFSVPETPKSKKMEKVSGLMNIPNKPGRYPIIIMFRGFIDNNMYSPGMGTQPTAEVLAKNGFITVAPDFLGYGQSASPSADPFENRFQTYTTALTLLSSIKTISTDLATQYNGTISADLSKIGIWGHSNGGQIALSTLAISKVTYPTVLWAPVSVSFPYSILYYTAESDDQGKSLRKVLTQFEANYNTDQFSPPLYYNFIKAPIEIDQGTNDHEVPVWWSDNLVAILKRNNADVTYNTYSGADHNLLPNGWSQAVLNTVSFYKKSFSN